jgi:hypothetical protein
LYWAARSVLELRLIEGAPQLSVRYEGRTIGTTTGRHADMALEVRGPLYVEVDDGERRGVVPLILADPEHFVPRGTPMDLDLETFCLLLAGARDIPPVPGDLPRLPTVGPSGNGGSLGVHGAIPWRRLLAAMRGLAAELLREGSFPRGVAFVLANETRLGGLRRRLRDARERGRLLQPDYAYALHELLCVLREAADALHDEPASQQLIDATYEDVRQEMTEIAAGFAGAIAAQLRILSREIAR